MTKTSDQIKQRIKAINYLKTIEMGIKLTTLLKEENGQIIFLYHNSKWNEAEFMWFYKENIEVILNGNLLSIHKRNFDKLSLGI